MTTLELPVRSRLSLVPRTPTHTVTDCMSRLEPSRLSARECDAVIARNNWLTLTLWLQDGRRRFTRERYCSAGTSLYIAPSWVLSSFASDDFPVFIEGDVSEVESLLAWRYVTLTGSAVLLQPTGSQMERRHWQEGIEFVRQVLELPDTQALQFQNFGILCVDQLEAKGSVALLELDNVVLPEMARE